jgi:RNA polymerase sigma factor (sigma-70 family)
MGRGRNQIVLRHVRTLFDVGTVGGLTDGELLDRFEAGPGEVAELAFAVLVERHGPMVLRACRRILRDDHDAQDAFQATFLVLARKGGTVRRRDTLGPWLHGVACRVAACARTAAARRRRLEVAAGKRTDVESRDRPDNETGAAIHEEIDCLPDRYRTPIVLCCLEGLTREQAALRLGWRVGTVQSRLARGRERLRERLLRRGLAPAVGTVAASLAAEAAGSVPTPLIEATVILVKTSAAGSAVAGVVPVAVASLFSGVLRAMFLQKMKAVVASAAVATIGVGIVWAQDPGPRGRMPSARAESRSEDRFEQLERKIDRLIQAIEVQTDRAGRISPRVADAQIAAAEEKLKGARDRLSWAEQMAGRGILAAGQVQAERASLKEAELNLERARAEAPDDPSPRRGLSRNSSGEATPRPVAPVPAVPPVAPATPAIRYRDLPDAGRIERIEQRIEALERRLDALEKRPGERGATSSLPDQHRVGVAF